MSNMMQLPHQFSLYLYRRWRWVEPSALTGWLDEDNIWIIQWTAGQRVSSLLGLCRRHGGNIRNNCSRCFFQVEQGSDGQTCISLHTKKGVDQLSVTQWTRPIGQWRRLGYQYTHDKGSKAPAAAEGHNKISLNARNVKHPIWPPGWICKVWKWHRNTNDNIFSNFNFQ